MFYKLIAISQKQNHYVRYKDINIITRTINHAQQYHELGKKWLNKVEKNSVYLNIH